MCNLGIKRLVLAAMLLLLSAALSGASAPQRDEAEGSGSLAGQFQSPRRKSATPALRRR